MSYLLRQTRQYLKDCSGSDLWTKLGPKAKVVFTHPNGWGARQQKSIQQAAIAAGLVSKNSLGTRLFFVEEGEAAATYCLDQPIFATNLKVILSPLHPVTEVHLLSAYFGFGLGWEQVHRLRCRRFYGRHICL